MKKFKISRKILISIGCCSGCSYGTAGGNATGCMINNSGV
jgi:hypothetical protein